MKVQSLINYLQSFVVQYFERVVGHAVDARPTVDELCLVAGLWVSRPAAWLLTLHGKRDFCHQFAVEDNDIEAWLDLCCQCWIAQLRHPLTVCRRGPRRRRPAAAGVRRRRCRRRGGTPQIRREMTDVRHRYHITYTSWQTDWVRELIPEVGWCIAKITTGYFFKKTSRWTSKNDDRWGSSTTWSLERD